MLFNVALVFKKKVSLELYESDHVKNNYRCHFFLFSFLEHMVLVIIQCCHELTFLCSPRFRPRTIPQVFPCFSHCFSETDDDVCS